MIVNVNMTVAHLFTFRELALVPLLHLTFLFPLFK